MLLVEIVFEYSKSIEVYVYNSVRDKGEDRYIPTREANTMTQAEFNSLMPKEFWFEVMEELGKTAPDTLIMAEA